MKLKGGSGGGGGLGVFCCCCFNKTLFASTIVEQIMFNKNFKWDSYWEVNVQIIADVSSCSKIQETLSGM